MGLVGKAAGERDLGDRILGQQQRLLRARDTMAGDEVGVGLAMLALKAREKWLGLSFTRAAASRIRNRVRCSSRRTA